MRVQEIDAVMHIIDRAFDPYWREAWSRAQVSQSLSFPSTHLLLVDVQGRRAKTAKEAVAFALSRNVVDEEELLLIAVLPELRGKGLGGTLLELLARNAAERQVTRLFLEMRSNNPAETLYRRHGYEQIGRREAYYRTLDGQTLDAITFARSLCK